MNFIHVTDKESTYVISDTDRHVFFMHNFSGVLDIDIQSENAEVYIIGLYVGKGSEEFDIKTIQRHSVGKSVSDLFIKGVFFDESKFTYEGLIRIEKGAQLSNAYQKNQNLMMSDKVFVDSRPFLEINANDVRCTHGSTTGQLSKDQLLYLQTRGLNKSVSEKLLIEGFVDDLFSRLSNTVSSEMIQEIQNLHEACLDSIRAV